MKYQLATLALAGSSYAALEGYAAAPPAYGSESSSSVVPPTYAETSSAPSVPAYGASTSAPSVPAYGASTTSAPASSSTTYACNPAHQYPEGQVCTEVSGSLTLVTKTGSSSAASATTPSGTTVTDVVSSFVVSVDEIQILRGCS